MLNGKPNEISLIITSFFQSFDSLLINFLLSNEIQPSKNRYIVQTLFPKWFTHLRKSAMNVTLFIAHLSSLVNSNTIAIIIKKTRRHNVWAPLITTSKLKQTLTYLSEKKKAIPLINGVSAIQIFRSIFSVKR